MRNVSDALVASTVAEFEAILARTEGLDVNANPETAALPSLIADIKRDLESVALGEFETHRLRVIAIEQLNHFQAFRGEPAMIEVALQLAQAAEANPEFASALEQSAVQLSHQHQMSPEYFFSALQASKILNAGPGEILEMEVDGVHDEVLLSDLQTLADHIQEQAGLAAIRARAKAFEESAAKQGRAQAVAAVTVDAAREWVSADVQDFRVISDVSESREAAVTMLVNAGRVPLYSSELKSQEPELAVDLKARMSEEIHLSPIHARFLENGVPSGDVAMADRASDDALDFVLGCDDTGLGRSVIQRLLADEVYRGEFSRTVGEFIALNQEGPFYDAQRFWSAQRLVVVAERKAFLKAGGTPELPDWKILLEEVLQKQRRPLSGNEFKEVVHALEVAARDAGTHRTDLREVVGLLAKVHGSSGESLFQNGELRSAYREGLHDEPGALKAASIRDQPYVRERRLSAQRPG